MTPLLGAFIFAFGAIIGSFLNALIWRLRTGESVAHGRSYCPHCRTTLAAIDLVPIFSWLALRGRCRYCRAGIHPSYLAVEIATALLFLAAARRDLPLAAPIAARDLAALLLHWYALAVLVVAFVYDYKYMLILPRVTFPATVIVVAGNLALGMAPWRIAAGAALMGGFFWLQHRLSNGRWVGGGDVHLGAFIGALVGWPLALVGLLFAYVSGAVVGVAMLATKRVKWSGQIPFGTFLAVAAAVALLYGDGIVAWYVGLL